MSNRQELQTLSGYPKVSPGVLTNTLAKGMALRMEQHVRMVIKPNPKLVHEKLWLKMASLFVYIERTQPSLTMEESNENL